MNSEYLLSLQAVHSFHTHINNMLDITHAYFYSVFIRFKITQTLKADKNQRGPNIVDCAEFVVTLLSTVHSQTIARRTHGCISLDGSTLPDGRDILVSL